MISRLLKDHPHSFGYSVSHTTRDIRAGEVNGQSYHFVSVPQFQSLMKNDAFVEHAVVHETYYGTSYSSVENVLRENRVCIMDLDLVGARALKDSSDFRCIVIFVAPPSFAELERRLRGRGTETESRIAKRLADGREWVTWAEDHKPFFDLYEVNDNLDECYDSFRRVVMASAFSPEKAASKKCVPILSEGDVNRMYGDVTVAE